MSVHDSLENLARLSERRALRLTLTEQAVRRLALHPPWSIMTLVRSSMRCADEDAQRLHEYVTSPVPRALEYALETELALWHRLDESLRDFRQAEPSQNDLCAYVANLKVYLSYQADLLRTQEEVLATCVGPYYETVITELRQAAGKVPL